MEIIKAGKKFKGVKSPEQKYFNKKKRCKKCGCKFRFNSEDIEEAYSVIGIKNYYVRCPQCNYAIYLSEVIENKVEYDMSKM